METAVAEMTETAEVAAVTIDKETGELVPVNACSDFSSKTFKHTLGELNTDGIRKLFAGEFGVIRMAVDDARALSAAGILKNGKLVTEKLHRQMKHGREVETLPCHICDGMTVAEVKELLLSLDDRNLGLLLRLGDINISPRRIRAKLGFEW